MKAIKIIIGIIIFLSLVFLSTGLIIKENNYTVKVVIDKPVENVFREFNRIDQIREWIPEIKSIDTIYFNPQITGSEFKMVVDNRGEEITMQEKVLAYIPNEKVTLYFDAESMLKTDQYSFTEEDEKTIVTLNSSFKSESSYLLSCIFPYFKGTLKEIDQRYLNNFKSFVEK